jgi:hypothetical protein
MPNWCENSLTVSHEDATKIDALVESWNEDKFFGTILPEPDYTTTPVKKTFPQVDLQYATTEEEKAKVLEPTINESNWWDWRVQHWGTKWEIESADRPPYRNGNDLYVSFDTAWSPPIGIYEALVEQGYSVSAKYYEGGCAFCGAWTDGFDDFYNIEGKYDWIIKNIPKEIDEEFCISENTLDWNMSDLIDDIEATEEKLKTATGEEKLKLEAELNNFRTELNILERCA